ncbi:peroxide stress protein YaaA [Campylobacter upsaliensis]|uniref:peroxide stress protein YaaA n=1 Tax=Campylobacter upsaliensis TaxID=28080 RepID=UPI0022EAC60D|nr:peroxide stress protein YaaA [Campylobacter upsaliensis]
MKILFSPSESKDLNCSLSPFDESSFIFRELFKFRLEALKNYENYIKNATQEDLQKLFGVKNPPQEFLQDLKNAPTKYAIELYTGVSYEFLAYQNLCRRKNKISIWKNKTSIKVEILFFYKP